jgi:hypothetical protein
MKRNKNESGSLHAVIIAVLFVALMATLGVVFYQNFIAKKADTSDQAKQSSSVTPSKETTRVAFGSTIYEFDHLDNWKVITTKAKESVMGGSTTKITSPNGTTRVTFTITETNSNPICDGNDGLKLSSYHVSTTTSSTLVGIPLYLVETLSDNPGGGYQYAIGLTPDSGDTHAAVGQTHCTVMHVGTASTVLFNGQVLVHPTVVAMIDFPKLPTAPKAAAKDMQTIKDLMNTDDYRAAVKILESARKE